MIRGGEDRQMFAELQARFRREGEQICSDLLSRPPESLDPAEVKRRAHEWAGIGGMLGFPEITAQARRIEQVLATSPGAWQPEVVAVLNELRGLFTGTEQSE